MFATLKVLLAVALVGAGLPAGAQTRTGELNTGPEAFTGASALASPGCAWELYDAAPELAADALLAATTGPKLLGPGKWRPTSFKPGERDNHSNKHAGEWGAGNITKDAYLKRAQSIIGREPGGESLGHTRANGGILRYNRRTNEFAVGAQDGTSRMLFRPKDGLNDWNKQVGP